MNDQDNSSSPGNGVRRQDGGSGTAPVTPPDPEVPAKATRRHFSAAYKKRILEAIDACDKGSGDIASLLRREGLYSSHLTTWKQQREAGTVAGLAPKKRGRKAKPVNPLAKKVAELERENRSLQKQLTKAETIIDFQKKLSEILEIPLKDGEGK